MVKKHTLKIDTKDKKQQIQRLAIHTNNTSILENHLFFINDALFTAVGFLGKYLPLP